MRKLTASKSLVLVALAAAIGSIGGTGHATPNAALHADVGDRGTANAASNAALGTLSRDWQGPRRAAFIRLVAAERAFARARAANESGATSDAVDAEQAQGDVFVATLQRLVSGRLSRGASSLAATDGSLNDAYGRVMKVDDTDELGWGDVRKSGILRTERAWIVYRDAFAAFAGTLGVPGAEETIAWELTRQRTAALDAFLGD